MSTLHWEIPKQGPNKPSWSELFRRAQMIADTYTETANTPYRSEIPVIRDYSITQNSLAQVFLRLLELTSDRVNL